MADEANENLGSDDSVEDPSGEGLSGVNGLDDSQWQSQVESLEQRRRALQGEADRQRARAQHLEAQLSEFDGLKAELDALKGQLSKIPTVEELASAVESRQRMMDFRSDLAARYPGVDVSQVQGGTPEEMEDSAKALHAHRTALEAAVKADVEAQIRKEYAERLGADFDANFHAEDQGDGGPADSGAMTVEKFIAMDAAEAAAMSDEEFAKWAAEAAAKGFV